MTVKVNLKQPSGAALASLAVEAGMIVSPAALKKLGQDFGRQPVGTGPYKFAEWVGGSQIRFVRNELYWRDGADGKRLPYADAVTLRIIPTTAVKMVEVKSRRACGRWRHAARFRGGGEEPGAHARLGAAGASLNG